MRQAGYPTVDEGRIQELRTPVNAHPKVTAPVLLRVSHCRKVRCNVQ
jgi:hypothetical protein